MSDLIPAGIGPYVQTLGTSQIYDDSQYAWQGSTWWQQLQPGSWRGVGFVMDTAQTKAGRRVALHEYPYRDTVWPEDLGKLPRRFTFTAFLVGDDVYQQRDAMLSAAEQPGEGTLVHPTMGTLQCVMLDCNAIDRRERGRVVELAFAFIMAGDILYPQTLLATGANVLDCAGALNTASASDLARQLTGTPTAALRAASAMVGPYAAGAVSLVNDATRAINAVRGLTGYFGRYATGARAQLLPPGATAQSCLANAITQRTATLNAANGLRRAASGL